MIVAASTSCVTTMSLQDILDRLADLEYTNVELVIGEQQPILISELVAQYDSIIHTCRTSRRITPVAIYFEPDPTTPNYLELFKAACQLAKAIKIVVMTVRASIPGTPFNEEYERLRNLVHIAMSHGVVVGLQTEIGRMTEMPDTLESLCKSIKGLGVTLDPSHYIFNQSKPKDYESILNYVCHVRLRDTTPTQFQVRIGQGILEFGRLVIQLSKADYHRTLCVDLAQLPDVDSMAELRKMRLLLESLL
ncbi:MAG: sugar phosphate isomerase/epimerase [Planctomycetaceae bacterium]|nr:sugar phosphate isomerase/epimerase [Planctomycetaceae bacterium]